MARLLPGCGCQPPRVAAAAVAAAAAAVCLPQQQRQACTAACCRASLFPGPKVPSTSHAAMLCCAVLSPGPDEHYIPTLLAVHGLEGEAECGSWGVAAQDWSKGGAHPKEYRCQLCSEAVLCRRLAALPPACTSVIPVCILQAAAVCQFYLRFPSDPPAVLTRSAQRLCTACVTRPAATAAPHTRVSAAQLGCWLVGGVGAMVWVLWCGC